MPKTFKRLTSFLTLLSFFFTQLGILPQAWAETPSSSEVALVRPAFQLDLPSEFGTVEAITSGSGPTLIHIQEAHGNYEAQKKIQSILHHLKDQYGVKLVLVEGNAFRLRPELLRFFPDQMDLTMKVLEDLAKKSVVTGPELFLAEEKEAQGYGVEDLKTYVLNGAAFKEVLAKQQETSNFLKDMDVAIERLTSPYLNKDLRAFLKRVEAFEAKQVPFEDWLNELKVEAKKRLEVDLENPAFQADWPMLLRVFKLNEFESKLNLAAFQTEKIEFLKTIALVPEETRAEVEKLLSSPRSEHRLSDPETGLLFERMIAALPQDFNYSVYPNVNLFIGHLILKSELKGKELVDEIERLSETITEKMAVTGEEKKIIELLADHRLLKKLFALELVPEEYEEIAAEEHRPSKLIERFLVLNGDKRVKNVKFQHTEEINALFDKALEFYRLATTRDEIMIKNVENRMKETGLDKAVVITGGFHAQPFRNFFDEKDYNYALISPKITSAEGRENYVKTILQDFLMPESPMAATYGVTQRGAATLPQILNHRFNPAASETQILAGIYEGLSEAGTAEAAVNETINAIPRFGQIRGQKVVTPARNPSTGRPGYKFVVGDDGDDDDKYPPFAAWVSADGTQVEGADPERFKSFVLSESEIDAALAQATRVEAGRTDQPEGRRLGPPQSGRAEAREILDLEKFRARVEEGTVTGQTDVVVVRKNGTQKAGYFKRMNNIAIVVSDDDGLETIVPLNEVINVTVPYRAEMRKEYDWALITEGNIENLRRGDLIRGKGLLDLPVYGRISRFTNDGEGERGVELESLNAETGEPQLSQANLAFSGLSFGDLVHYRMEFATPRAEAQTSGPQYSEGDSGSPELPTGGQYVEGMSGSSFWNDRDSDFRGEMRDIVKRELIGDIVIETRLTYAKYTIRTRVSDPKEPLGVFVSYDHTLSGGDFRQDAVKFHDEVANHVRFASLTGNYRASLLAEYGEYKKPSYFATKVDLDPALRPALNRVLHALEGLNPEIDANGSRGDSFGVSVNNPTDQGILESLHFSISRDPARFGGAREFQISIHERFRIGTSYLHPFVGAQSPDIFLQMVERVLATDRVDDDHTIPVGELLNQWKQGRPEMRAENHAALIAALNDKKLAESARSDAGIALSKLAFKSEAVIPALNDERAMLDLIGSWYAEFQQEARGEMRTPEELLFHLLQRAIDRATKLGSANREKSEIPLLAGSAGAVLSMLRDDLSLEPTIKDELLAVYEFGGIDAVFSFIASAIKQRSVLIYEALSPELKERLESAEQDKEERLSPAERIEMAARKMLRREFEVYMKDPANRGTELHNDLTQASLMAVVGLILPLLGFMGMGAAGPKIMILGKISHSDRSEMRAATEELTLEEQILSLRSKVAPGSLAYLALIWAWEWSQAGKTDLAEKKLQTALANYELTRTEMRASEVWPEAELATFHRLVAQDPKAAVKYMEDYDVTWTWHLGVDGASTAIGQKIKGVLIDEKIPAAKRLEFLQHLESAHALFESVFLPYSSILADIRKNHMKKDSKGLPSIVAFLENKIAARQEMREGETGGPEARLEAEMPLGIQDAVPFVDTPVAKAIAVLRPLETQFPPEMKPQFLQVLWKLEKARGEIAIHEAAAAVGGLIEDLNGQKALGRNVPASILQKLGEAQSILVSGRAENREQLLPQLIQAVSDEKQDTERELAGSTDENDIRIVSLRSLTALLTRLQNRSYSGDDYARAQQILARRTEMRFSLSDWWKRLIEKPEQLSMDQRENIRARLTAHQDPNLIGVLISPGQEGTERGFVYALVKQKGDFFIGDDKDFAIHRELQQLPFILDGIMTPLVLEDDQPQSMSSFEMFAHMNLIPVAGQKGIKIYGADPTKPVYPDWTIVGRTASEDTRLIKITHERVDEIASSIRRGEVRMHWQNLRSVKTQLEKALKNLEAAHRRVSGAPLGIIIDQLENVLQYPIFKESDWESSPSFEVGVYYDILQTLNQIRDAIQAGLNLAESNPDDYLAILSDLQNAQIGVNSSIGELRRAEMRESETGFGPEVRLEEDIVIQRYDKPEAGATVPRNEMRDYYDEMAESVVTYADQTSGVLPIPTVEIVRKYRLSDIKFDIIKLSKAEKIELWKIAIEFMRELKSRGGKILMSEPAAGKASRMQKGLLPVLLIEALHRHPEIYANPAHFNPEETQIIQVQFKGDWQAYVRSLDPKPVVSDGKLTYQDTKAHDTLNRILHEAKGLLPADLDNPLVDYHLMNVKKANDQMEALGLDRPFIAQLMLNEEYYPLFIRHLALTLAGGLNVRFVDKAGNPIEPNLENLESVADIDHNYQESELILYNQPLAPRLAAPAAVVERQWRADQEKEAKALALTEQANTPNVNDEDKKKLLEQATERRQGKTFQNEKQYQYALNFSKSNQGKAIRAPKALAPGGHGWYHMAKFMSGVGSRQEPALITAIKRRVELDFLHNVDNMASVNEDWMLILGHMIKNNLLLTLEASRKPSTERGSGGGAFAWVRDGEGIEVNPKSADGTPTAPVKALLRQLEYAIIAPSLENDPVTGQSISLLYQPKPEAEEDAGENKVPVNNATMNIFTPRLDENGKLIGEDVYSRMVGREVLEEAIRRGLEGDYDALRQLTNLMQQRMGTSLTNKPIKDPTIDQPGPDDIVLTIIPESFAWDVQKGEGVRQQMDVALVPSIVDVDERPDQIKPEDVRFDPLKDRAAYDNELAQRSREALASRMSRGELFGTDFLQIIYESMLQPFISMMKVRLPSLADQTPQIIQEGREVLLIFEGPDKKQDIDEAGIQETLNIAAQSFRAIYPEFETSVRRKAITPDQVKRDAGIVQHILAIRRSEVRNQAAYRNFEKLFIETVDTLIRLRSEGAEGVAIEFYRLTGGGEIKMTIPSIVRPSLPDELGELAAPLVAEKLVQDTGINPLVTERPEGDVYDFELMTDTAVFNELRNTHLLRLFDGDIQSLKNAYPQWKDEDIASLIANRTADHLRSVAKARGVNAAAVEARHFGFSQDEIARIQDNVNSLAEFVANRLREENFFGQLAKKQPSLQSQTNPNTAIRIEDAGFSVRTTNFLIEASVTTLGDLERVTPGELKGRARGFGQIVEDEIRANLASRGLKLRGEAREDREDLSPKAEAVLTSVLRTAVTVYRGMLVPLRIAVEYGQAVYEAVIEKLVGVVKTVKQAVTQLKPRVEEFIQQSGLAPLFSSNRAADTPHVVIDHVQALPLTDQILAIVAFLFKNPSVKYVLMADGSLAIDKFQGELRQAAQERLDVDLSQLPNFEIRGVERGGLQTAVHRLASATEEPVALITVNAEQVNYAPDLVRISATPEERAAAVIGTSQWISELLGKLSRDIFMTVHKARDLFQSRWDSLVADLQRLTLFLKSA